MTRRKFLTLASACAVLWLVGCVTPSHENRVVRVAVVGGMIRSGLWSQLAARFEADSGYKVEVTVSGNREVLVEAFRAGEADLVTLHAGEVGADLLAMGYGINMRPWTRNEFVIIGPRSDPAGIRGLRDGAAAFARIAKAPAPFVDYQNSGPRDVAAALWRKANIRPEGNWFLKSESGNSEEVLEFAQKRSAYVVLGRVPMVPGDMEILVQGDPEMHRSFVVMQANPKKFQQANAQGAQALADYLLTAKTQNFLQQFGTNSPPGMPLFYPIRME